MDLDAVAGLHDDYRTLIDFWRAKKPADEPAPRFRDIDLMDLYTIAARLVIVDVETGAGSDRVYRWRYAGSALRDVDYPTNEIVYASVGVGLRMQITWFVNLQFEVGVAYPLVSGDQVRFFAGAF